MPNRLKSGLWPVAACAGLLAAPAVPAQEPAAVAATDEAAKQAQARGTQAFQDGARAYEQGKFDVALTHYQSALTHFGKAWPGDADADTRRRVLLQVRRARAFAHGKLGKIDGFLEDAHAALRLIGALGGDGPEEQAIQSALFECLRIAPTLAEKLRLLGGYRRVVEANIPANQTAGRGLSRRLQVQIGQILHEMAFAHDRAGKLEEAAPILEQAIEYRGRINDLAGACWSSQNLFWNLLRRRELDAAAGRFNATVAILQRAPNVDVEGSLVGNLTGWIEARVKADERPAARSLLKRIRLNGSGVPGLPTLTRGQLAAMELALIDPAKIAGRDPRRAIAATLLLSGKSEAQPAWTWLAHATNVRLTLQTPRAERSKAENGYVTKGAESALRAAEALQDPRRIGLARLLMADALLDEAEPAVHELAEQEIRAAWDAAGTTGDLWLREVARRTGASLATTAGNDEWKARYTLTKAPAQPGQVGGQTMMGRTQDDFFRAVASMPGEGAILTLTRRDQYLILRSPLFPGTLAIEWSHRLRYVNANGILLAIHGPAVAVIGKHADLAAPKARSGVVRTDDAGNLDLALLAGESLPPFASQAVIPPGETAFVNKYLRVFR